ncbi:MAG: hypothetical protein WBO04_16980 [Steroidobacteraceae bacterium]
MRHGIDRDDVRVRPVVRPRGLPESVLDVDAQLLRTVVNYNRSESVVSAVVSFGQALARQPLDGEGAGVLHDVDQQAVTDDQPRALDGATRSAVTLDRDRLEDLVGTSAAQRIAYEAVDRRAVRTAQRRSGHTMWGPLHR